MSDAKRLDDERFHIKGYRIDTETESKQMRIVFYGNPGQKDVLGYLILDAPESYDMASRVLKSYDKLEGIK